MIATQANRANRGSRQARRIRLEYVGALDLVVANPNHTSTNVCCEMYLILRTKSESHIAMRSTLSSDSVQANNQR